MNIEQIQLELTDKLTQLQQRLAKIEKDMSKSHSADSSEQAVERENDEVLEEIGQETLIAIDGIQAALNRLKAGTYGRCANCSADITPARLTALPETTLCVSCAADQTSP